MSQNQPSLATSSPGGRAHYGLVILSLGILSVTVALGLGRFAYTMILPEMRLGLGLDYTETGLLATGNFVGYSVSALFSGLLAARFGARVVVACGAALVGVTMILTGTASDLTTALVMRTLTGLGSAACVIGATGLQVAWFAPKRRGLATGGISGGGGLGLIISGAFIPFVFTLHAPEGWRFAWYYCGVAGLVAAAVILAFARNHPGEMGLKPIGAGRDEGRTDGNGANSPSVRAVYGSRSLQYLGLVYAAWGFAYIIVSTFFAAFLADERGFDPGFVGTLWATAGVISTVSGLAWGSVSDVIGRRFGLAIVFMLQSACFFLFVRADSVAWLWLATAMYGATAFSVPAIMGATAGDIAGPRLAATALGFITLIFGVGQALGPSVGGLLADSTGTFEHAFLLSAAVTAVGALMSLLFKPRAEHL